jgi:U32 family peptidase
MGTPRISSVSQMNLDPATASLAVSNTTHPASLTTRSHAAVRPPELLAPAGDWDCAKAAVENGADAIYFGLESFNARMRAQNFTVSDLPALLAFLHRRGVKGYVTLNTLVFTRELAEAERVLREVIAAGVDAAIVQDVGLCRLIRRLSPDFPIHASTQMTITSAAGVRFAKSIGCNLVVLAREVPVLEMERIQSELDGPVGNGAALPLEVFVHGALCVAYSGQCLTSEALGGRSANRGVCAQACRLPYDLVADGETVPLGDRRYLLSPQDLVGVELLPDLIRARVSSLKIEGRLKTPTYVANITRIYRQAIDRVMAELAASIPTPHEPAPDSTEKVDELARGLMDESRYDVEMTFSRGLYTGWMRGINNQQLVHGRFGKKRGVYLGDVVRVDGDRVIVRLEGPLKPGDGVVFDAGRPDLDEEGGRVYHVDPLHPDAMGSQTALRFGHGDLRLSQIRPGNKLWKTSDPELERRVRQSYAGDVIRFQRPIRMELRGSVGQPLHLLADDECGHQVQLESAMPLAAATRQPLTTRRLEEQLGRLGGTPFRLGHLENLLEGDILIPVSELNRLRRELVRYFESVRSEPLRWTLLPSESSILECSVFQPPHADPAAVKASEDAAADLVVLVRNLAQLEAALNAQVNRVYCDFEDPKRYREAVDQFRAWQKSSTPIAPGARPGLQTACTLYVAPPRIFKTGESWILNQVQSCGADGYLARNPDHLAYFAGAPLVGDLTLNVANPLTAEHFIRTCGLERVTASCDLNQAELEALLRAAPPDWFEIVLHQHMPMFHMEHCVFCAFLSEGTDYTNCGRPCDRHELRLRDRVGAEHPVKADAGCRNTVFNAMAQTGAEYVGRFLAAGARHFRIEFLNEPPEQVTRTIGMYQQLLRGELTGSQLWRELKLINQLGVTRGPMA